MQEVLMASQANGNHRPFQDDTLYALPKDMPEHDRLDGQSASLVFLMNNRPFHAPVSNPKKILDMGCGTGSMTHMLGQKFPEAQVFGLDIAPVPESRHGLLDNVHYVQGDILKVIGNDPRFEIASFDYVFQRFLMYGVKDWAEYIPSISRLLKPGGWVEMHEPSMQLRSGQGERLADSMPWYQTFKADAAEIGQDSEIGDNLLDHFQSSSGLANIQESRYGFAPFPSKDKPELQALCSQCPDLFSIVIRKISGAKRGEEEGENLVKDLRSTWDRGFNEGDHFDVSVVIGQK